MRYYQPHKTRYISSHLFAIYFGVGISDVLPFALKSHFYFLRLKKVAYLRPQFPEEASNRQPDREGFISGFLYGFHDINIDSLLHI